MFVNISRDQLAKIFPRPATAWHAQIYDGYADALCSWEGGKALYDAGITDALSLKHFCATIDVESGGLGIIWESGAYSAATILRVFGAGHHSSAVTPAEAQRIAALKVNPDGSGPRCEALFERVYGCTTKIGRQLGNTKPGDGPRFRGLGFNQLTGRDAHTRTAKALGVTLDDLTQPINLLRAALLEWTQKKCNVYARKDDYLSIRKLINGGSLKVPESRLNGLDRVRAFLKKSDARFAGIVFDAPDPVPVEDAVASAVAEEAAGTTHMAVAKAAQTTGVTVAATSALLDLGDNLGRTVNVFRPIKINIDALREIVPLRPDFIALVVGGAVVFFLGRYLAHVTREAVRTGKFPRLVFGDLPAPQPA